MRGSAGALKGEGSRKDAKTQRDQTGPDDESVKCFLLRLRCFWKEGRELLTENALAKEIVDAAFRIHTTLGPGLLESVYETVLALEMDRRGLRTVRQQPVPVIYEGAKIDAGFRADLIVEDKVIVEIKSVESLAPVHKKQLRTYLRLANKRLGPLINFNVALIKDGIARVVNELEDEVPVG